MAIGKRTYGINFPFRDSAAGDYLDLTTNATQQIKSDLAHLLLTRKGSRYFMPSFGTNLYQFLFEPIDDIVVDQIQNEIVDACDKFLPMIKIKQVSVISFVNDPTYVDDNKKQHQLRVSIDYEINTSVFSERDNLTLNL